MTWQPPKELVRLSGGNPQVPKGDGEAPVRYFIDNMPDWQRAVGRRLDAITAEVVPDVERAVRWNSPFYGAGQGWFLSFHCFTKYVKVTFFRGSALDPEPPVGSKDPNARYYHVTEEGVDEAQFRKWVEQAAALPGWDGS